MNTEVVYFFCLPRSSTDCVLYNTIIRNNDRIFFLSLFTLKLLSNDNGCLNKDNHEISTKLTYNNITFRRPIRKFFNLYTVIIIFIFNCIQKELYINLKGS